MSGPPEAFPDFTNAKNQQGVANALKGALDLDAAYEASNIRVWHESTQTLSGSRRRLQAATGNILVVLGYQLAKVQGLPEEAALEELVKNSNMGQRVAEGLAEESLIAEEFAGSISIAVVQGVSADQVVKDVTSGVLQLKPVGESPLQPGC
jgi:hypothetical protein